MSTRRLLVDMRPPNGVSDNDPMWLRLREVIETINNSALSRGRLITAEEGQPAGSGLVFQSSVARSIPHKLGRKAFGFLEITAADLHSGDLSIEATTFPAGQTSEHFVSVVSGADGRCFLWVF